MHDPSIPVLVLSDHHDDTERFNKTLRDSGRAVRCHGLAPAGDLAGVLASMSPHLLVLFRDHHAADIAAVAAQREQHAPLTPLVVIADTADESSISAALLAGAQDLASFEHPERIVAICARELKTNRLERALNHALVSTEEYRSEVQSLLSNSADAIAVVQEGIVVDSNQAWADLFANPDSEPSNGPLMDFFAAESQAVIKNALIACNKRQWDGSVLRIEALNRAGERIVASLSLESSFHDGEPAIRVGIQPEVSATAPQGTPDQTSISSALDPTTGFLNRNAFLNELTDRLLQPRSRGARALAYIRPDKFKQVEQVVGPMLTEDIIAQISAIPRGRMEATDLAGRFDGIVMTMLIERDSLDDISSWLEATLAEISQHVFEAADRSLSLTCSAGVAEIGSDQEDLVELLQLAENANQRCRQAGGNKVVVEETSDANTLIRRADALWVQRIKSALVDNRFRLVTFNIASLAGRSERMFETFVRMIDEQGDEVGTDEFIASAQRNKLLRPIDRWVIDASYRYCAEHACDVVFVKLSAESILDTELPAWVEKQLEPHGIGPHNVCFQVCEEDASHYMNQTRALAELLRNKGFRFAIENFGIGRDPKAVLNGTPMDYIKLDGSLMKTISGDMKLQEQIRDYTGLASRRSISTIATHVENANTMAMLFQLGVGYMQGHYVQEPEVILGEAV